MFTELLGSNRILPSRRTQAADTLISDDGTGGATMEQECSIDSIPTAFEQFVVIGESAYNSA